MQPRYSIKITSPTGFTAYMSFRGKTEWCYSQAKHHVKTWVYLHGWTAQMIKN